MGVDMDIGHDLGANGAHAADRRVETARFEPQGEAVADGLLRIKSDACTCCRLPEGEPARHTVAPTNPMASAMRRP